MSFGSISFLALFLPAIWLLHWLLPRRAPLQNVLLLVASYVFYASVDPRLLSILIVATLVNFGAIQLMDRVRGKKRLLKATLWAAVAYNVGQLVVFKYLGFFAESVGALIGQPNLLPILELVMPLGISFWTLQHLAYLADIYYDREKSRPTLLEYAVFAGFFPQVVSGPIPRGAELLPQLAAPRRLEAERVASGASTFMLGFVLKYFVADNLALHVVNPVFSEPHAYSGIAHWMALFGYAGQVFGDFAGYSIMARGCARLFSLELPLNFDYPFFSKNMLEYWRRWHITLNRLLFDYLYGPLMTSRTWLRGRADLGFLLVFALSGLWHGATWNFVIWGAIHGAALAIHRRYDELYRGLCRKDRTWVKRRRTRSYGVAAWTVTQLFFVVSLIPFRTYDVAAMGSFTAGLFDLSGLHHPLGGNRVGAVAVAVALLFLLVYHLAALPRGKAVWERIRVLPAPVRGAAWGLAIVVLAMLIPIGAGTFIYAQF